MKQKNFLEKVCMFIVFTSLFIFFVIKANGEDLGGIRSGETKASSIEPVADSDTFTFYGNTGDGVIIFASSSTFMLPYLELYDPDGFKETEGISISNHQLLKTGLYTIVIYDFMNNDTGEYSISFLKIPGPVLSPSDVDGGDITSGEVLSAEITPTADTDGFNFYGLEGNTVNITASSSTFMLPYLELYDPEGFREIEGISINNHQLLKAGLYTIVIYDFMNNDTGEYNVSLTKIPSSLPPGIYNPEPANGAFVSHRTSLLNWSDTEGATSYDIYFGTGVVTSLQRVAENITVSYFALSPLQVNTTYYWNVVAKNGSTDTFGPVWCFTTEVKKDDFLGTWELQGVYFRDSDTGSWIKLASEADMVDCGDLDGDGTDDLIGEWSEQSVWVRYSSTGSWLKLASSARDITSGDMNGNGWCDLVGTWDGQGVYYRNSINSQWIKLATPASQITAGDIDDDGTDDLIGIWPAQGGVWVKYSSSGSWSKLSSSADWIACGDMNGDGQDDFLGTWTGQGVYYKESATSSWVKIATAATQIAAGDMDGDGTDDLVGIWPGQGGVWVKYSSTSDWQRLSSTADWIACGRMRSESGSSTELALSAPIGGVARGPRWIEKHEDLSSKGPGGWNFVYQEGESLMPKEQGELRIMRIPGPGEPDFGCVEQKNLVPGHGSKMKKDKKKK